MNGNELKIYLIVVRKTKGWNKEFDGISISQFQKYGGIGSRNTVRKHLTSLSKLNLIKELVRDGKYSLFYLADPYQKMSRSKVEQVDDVPLPVVEHHPYQKLSIQTDTIKEEEEERRKLKLDNFEEFYVWLPKEKIRNEKFYKTTVKRNLLNDDQQTLDNFQSFIDEQESTRPQEAMIDIAEKQFKLLCVFIGSKAPNQILKLDREQTYQKYFEQPTNDFISKKGGLVELSSSLDNNNYHAGLLQELTAAYINFKEFKNEN